MARTPDDSPQVYVVSEITEEEVVLTSRYHKLTCRLERTWFGACVTVTSAEKLRRYRPVLALEVDAWFCVETSIEEGDLIINRPVKGLSHVES